MGPSVRHQFPDVVHKIIQHVNHCNFFQAVEILHQHAPAIRFKPSRSISFPESTIKKIDQNHADQLIVQVSFMGLYGVDTPLPHYFIDHTIPDNQRAQTLRSFLDIFHHRIYVLLHHAWKRCYPVTHPNHQDAPYMRYLNALSGNTLKQTDAVAFSFSGILGARIRSSAGLAGMLSDFLSKAPVSITQFIPQWQKIKTTTHLALGDNTLLGHHALNASQKIAIHIGPLRWKQACALLPHKKSALTLYDLITRYLGPLINFDLVLTAHPPDTDGFTLGHHAIRLGWSFWLGKRLSKIEISLPNPPEDVAAIEQSEIEE